VIRSHADWGEIRMVSYHFWRSRNRRWGGRPRVPPEEPHPSPILTAAAAGRRCGAGRIRPLPRVEGANMLTGDFSWYRTRALVAVLIIGAAGLVTEGGARQSGRSGGRRLHRHRPDPEGFQDCLGQRDHHHAADGWPQRVRVRADRPPRRHRWADRRAGLNRCGADRIGRHHPKQQHDDLPGGVLPDNSAGGR
jgi:hypothetical protein